MGGIHEKERGVYEEGGFSGGSISKRKQIVWTCVKGNVIGENEEYKSIGICVFIIKYLKNRMVGVFKR